MKKFQLEGSMRTDLGKKAAKAMRRKDLIPAVLYGGKESVNFTVAKEAVRKLVYSPEIFEVELMIDGKPHQAIMQELQFHPVSDDLLHLDFLEVVPGKPVVMDVPVILNGHAAGVRAGGKLALTTRTLRAKALIENMPEKVNIDVTDLELGKSIQVQDVKINNVQFLTAANAVVCAVNLTRAALSETNAAAPAAGESAAATPAATPAAAPAAAADKTAKK